MVYETAVNMTGLVAMMAYTNRVTNNYFVIGLLITAYVIPLIYVMLRGYDWTKASMASGFIVSITAILLRVTGITTVDRYLFFAIATIIVPFVIISLRDNST